MLENVGAAAVWRARIEIGLLKTVKVLRNNPDSIQTSADFSTVARKGSTVLHFAIGLGHAALGTDVIKSLLLCGADPNAALGVDDDGERPIHLASRWNSSVISALLGDVDSNYRKADSSLPNAKGECALELAVKKRRVRAVSALLGGGSNPNASDRQGERLLSCALLDQVEWGHGIISRLLRDFGASTDPHVLC